MKALSSHGARIVPARSWVQAEKMDDAPTSSPPLADALQRLLAIRFRWVYWFAPVPTADPTTVVLFPLVKFCFVVGSSGGQVADTTDRINGAITVTTIRKRQLGAIHILRVRHAASTGIYSRSGNSGVYRSGRKKTARHLAPTIQGPGPLLAGTPRRRCSAPRGHGIRDRGGEGWDVPAPDAWAVCAVAADVRHGPARP
jgi:hypothetical protein